jgi:hypothetical protein
MAEKTNPADRSSTRKGDQAQPQADTPEEDEDTTGHVLLPDPWMNQQLAQGRNAEIERALREQQRRKETRPSRDRR